MWDFRKPAWKTGARGRKATCQYMWSHGTMWHSTIPSAVTDWFDIYPRMIYSTFLNLIEEFFLNLETEGFWPNIPPGCNGCCMPRHHSWTLAGEDKTPCQRRRYQVWCRTCGQMQKTGQIRRLLFYLYFILLWLFCLYILYINLINGNCIAYFCYLAVMSCCK